MASLIGFTEPKEWDQNRALMYRGRMAAISSLVNWTENLELRQLSAIGD